MPHHLPPLLPPFIAPAQFTDAAAAMVQVQTIYNAQIEHLRSAMQRFVANGDTETNPANLQKIRAFYPFVRIHTSSVLRSQLPDLARLSFGFVAEPGRYETTLTRPDLYATYYLEQFRLHLAPPCAGRPRGRWRLPPPASSACARCCRLACA